MPRKITLLAAGQSYQTRKILIAAELAGVGLGVELEHRPAELMEMVPHAKSVVLKVEGDPDATSPLYLTRSNVILRYIAEVCENSGLYGKNLYESGLVDQWLDFSFNSIEVPAAAVVMSSTKDAKVPPAVASTALKELEKALGVLDAGLSKSTYLAGERLTVADVAVMCGALDVLKPHLDLLKRFSALGRWTLTVLHDPIVAKGLPEGKALAQAVLGVGFFSFSPLPALGPTSRGGSGSGSGASASPPSAPALAPDGPDACLFKRGRTLISEVLRKGLALEGSSLTVKGWARTIREANKGELLFLELSDGSTAKALQVILSKGACQGFEEARPVQCGGVGASFAVRGKVLKSPAKGQLVEVHAEVVEVLGKVYGGDDGAVGGKYYPLSKKAHSLEHLRSIAHLRPRTRVMGSVVRLRHAMAYATHKFFNDRGFRYIHTPIVTAADCEGAGEQFVVSTLMPNDHEKPALPLLKDGSVDFSKDFFGSRTCLTVSGQLNVETFACALSDVYTFGPTFRAENSHTTRHLAEFWMIEPEIAFADLQTDMALAEDYLKYCVWYALTHNEEDLALLEALPDGEKGLRERLHNVLDNPFHRITYTEAVQLLQDEISAGKVEFGVYPEWGCDLGSEHERYITERVFQKPVIVTNYPKGIKAFYMRVDEDGRTVSAMDILVPKIGEIIGGSQREERLDVLLERCKEMGLDPKALWWYLELRKYGSVPHAGFGLGFERLILFVTGLENIRDVIPFPRFPGHATF